MNKRQRAKPAFTLLEVLLASALSTVMLLGLWSLLSLHTRLFTKAPAGVEQSQLVRSLSLQLSHDLSSALPVLDGPMPRDARPPSDSATHPAPGMRRARLIGTRDTLQVDVLRAGVSETADSGAREATGTASAVGRLSELRTVSYSFAEPPVGERTRDAGPSGLMRQEWFWDTPNPENQSEPGMGEMDGQSRAASREQRGDSDPRRWRDSFEATSLAPEVISLEFRYFDGDSWSPWWDSGQRKALPVAVEVLLYLRSDTQGARRFQSADNVATGNRSRRDPEGHRVRMVVHLPTSTSASAARDVLDTRVQSSDTITRPLPATVGGSRSDPPTMRARDAHRQGFDTNR
jgi:hypothetical protein